MNHSSSQPSRLLLVLAFTAVYLVWGSTYLAIHVVVDTLPAFTSAAIRFLIAGGLLLILLAIKGTALPTRAQWRHSLISGTFLLVGGNGLVVWAEKSISSSLAALLVALAPVWFALLDWLRPGGVRPQAKTVIGIVVGFLGVAILVQRGDGGGGNTLPGTVAVIVAGLCWAGGSLYSKYSHNSGSPWMNAASQMLGGGAGLAVVGLLLGEPASTRWGQVSVSSILALLYLVVFGSWIGFSAYIWLLKNVSATQVSTYAYVNPVIAVFLGWAFLDESITSSMIAGAMVVLAGVAIISVPVGALAAVTRGTRWFSPRRIAPEPNN